MAHIPTAASAALLPTEPAAPPPLVLDRLAAGPTVPAVPAARWLDALHAPQAHPNARRDYGGRATSLLSLLAEPGLAELSRWAWGCWPGEVPALAGILSIAPILQAEARGAGMVDRPAAAELVAAAVAAAKELEAHRQRAGADRHRRPVVVVHGLSLDGLPAADDEGPTGEAPERAQQVVGWVGRQLRSAPTGGASGTALLVVEANLPAFWAWYSRRAPIGEIAAGRFPAPPFSRELGSGQRLEDHLSGSVGSAAAQHRRRLATVSRLLLGPRRHRNQPPGLGWRSGIGHWSLVALDAWSAGRNAPRPPSSTVRWWAQQLTLIEAQPAPWEAPAAPIARHDVVA